MGVMNQPLPVEGQVQKMIHRLRDEAIRDDLTLGEVFDILQTSGHPLVILFICLPFLQPIPLVGLSTPMGLLMALVAILHGLNRPAWIPERWKDKKLSGMVLIKTFLVAEKAFARIELFVRPRLTPLARNPFFHWLNVFLIVLNGVLLALPLPVPFSNMIPAWTIAILALGQLEEDGLVILLGYLVQAICLSFFAGLALGVEKGFGLLGW
jgi:hypothetical protein